MWGSQGVDYWSHHLRPQTGNLQLWTANGGKGLLWEINYGTGYVAFLGGHGDSSDQILKTAPQDADTEDCLQMLRQVSARTYERLDQHGKSSLGFIANQIKEAAPAFLRRSELAVVVAPAYPVRGTALSSLARSSRTACTLEESTGSVPMVADDSWAASSWT